LYTLVSRAQLPGEGSSSTLTTTVSVAPPLSLRKDLPPVVASGILTGLGNSTIVGNPNSGGPGVAIAVWSDQNVQGGNGSWQTCHLDEYLRNSAAELITYDDDVTDQIPGIVECGAQLAQCGCPAANTGDQLSGGGMDCNNCEVSLPEGEGIDLLDVDGNVGTLLDSEVFPCDLFGFVFGTQNARDDVNPPNDGICDQGTDANGDGINDVVANFMATNGAQIVACNTLGPNSSGLLWVQGPCALPNATRVGSPTRPVILEPG
jgi:hypothetical protein